MSRSETSVDQRLFESERAANYARYSRQWTFLSALLHNLSLTPLTQKRYAVLGPPLFAIPHVFSVQLPVFVTARVSQMIRFCFSIQTTRRRSCAEPAQAQIRRGRGAITSPLMLTHTHMLYPGASVRTSTSSATSLESPVFPGARLSAISGQLTGFRLHKPLKSSAKREGMTRRFV